MGRVFPFKITFTHNLGYKEPRFWGSPDFEGNIELAIAEFLCP
jgi:hypothetical protein